MNDPASPHSYANRRVLEALTKKLALSEATQLLHVDRTLRQTAAVELLREDSDRRGGSGDRPRATEWETKRIMEFRRVS